MAGRRHALERQFDAAIAVTNAYRSVSDLEEPNGRFVDPRRQQRRAIGHASLRNVPGIPGHRITEPVGVDGTMPFTHEEGGDRVVRKGNRFPKHQLRRLHGKAGPYMRSVMLRGAVAVGNGADDVPPILGPQGRKSILIDLSGNAMPVSADSRSP